MSKIYRDLDGEDVEVLNIVKVELRGDAPYIITDTDEKYLIEDCDVDVAVSEVNLTCYVIVTQDGVMVVNKLNADEAIAQYIEEGTLVEITRDTPVIPETLDYFKCNKAS